MNKPKLLRIIPYLLLATTALAEAETQKEIVIRRRADAGGPQFNIKVDRQGPAEPVEMKKVAFLGVESMPVDPTLAVQLGLPPGTGAVVRRVSEGSPAAGVLQPHDILTKLDDQILVNVRQLTVLVRNHKVGDEVRLTYIRGGKEATAKVKLGEREVPVMADMRTPFMHLMDEDGPGAGGMFFHGSAPGMPALAGPEAGDVMRVIGGDRMNWFAQPRVHVFKRQGGGPTILDLPAGNFVFTDDAGTVEVNSAGGKRELTVKDKQGAVTFQGPINTPEEHAKLPPEVKARLDVIGGAELGEDADELKIETKVFRPAQKTHRALPSETEPGMRSL